MPSGRDYLADIAEAERFKAFQKASETVECLDTLEQSFIETWATTDQPDIAHELWHRVRAIRQIRQEIQARVSNGELAQAEMKRDGDYQKAKAKPSRSKRSVN